MCLKPTFQLHNFPNLAVLARPLPFPTPTLIELRGWVMHKGERVARTLLAQPYPPDLSIEYGSLVTAFPDNLLASDFEGFPLGDELPPVLFSADPSLPKAKGIPFSSALLVEHRDVLNQVVQQGVREWPFSSNLLQLIREDVAEGCHAWSPPL